MTERDEKFLGFANLLYADIEPLLHELAELQPIGDIADKLKAVFARRAYDLVAHILNQTPTGTRYISLFRDIDMWPDNRRFADALADLAKISSNIKEVDLPKPLSDAQVEQEPSND